MIDFPFQRPPLRLLLPLASARKTKSNWHTREDSNENRLPASLRPEFSIDWPVSLHWSIPRPIDEIESVPASALPFRDSSQGLIQSHPMGRILKARAG